MRSWEYFKQKFIKALEGYLTEEELEAFIEKKKKEYEEILQEQNPLLQEVLLFDKKFYTIDDFIEELRKLGINEETAWFIIQNTKKVIHWFKEKPEWYDKCEMYKKIVGF